MEKINGTYYSNDGSIKFAITLKDNNIIEVGYFPVVGEYNHVLCISSQVGCGVNCVMCESGRNGFRRNLVYYEIYKQVELVYDYLTNKTIIEENGVFGSIGIMGVGEPGNNSNNVFAAVKLIRESKMVDKDCLINLATTGGKSGFISELCDHNIDLFLSLHFAIPEKRKEYIPGSQWELEELLDIADKSIPYVVNYITIKGLNDTEEDIKALVNLLKNRKKLRYVWLLSLNKTYKTAEIGMENSTEAHRSFIKTILESEGIPVSIQCNKGTDANIGCGQLRTIIQKISKL